MSIDSNKTLSRLQQVFKNQEEAMRANPKFGLPPAPHDSSQRGSNTSTPQPSALSLTAPKFGQYGEYAHSGDNDVQSAAFDFDLSQYAAELSNPLSLDELANSQSTSTTYNHPFNDQSTSTSYSTHDNPQPPSASASAAPDSTGVPSTAHPKSQDVVKDILSDDLLDQKLAKRKQSITSPLSPNSPQIDHSVDEDSKNDPIASQVWKMYAKQKTALPNGQRMENLTWRMMAMSLRRKRESEAAAAAAALKEKQQTESQSEQATPDADDDRSSHSSPTPEAQPPPESVAEESSKQAAEKNDEAHPPLAAERQVQPDEEDERGRKPRRQRAPRKQTNVVVGFTGKVPEGLDNGEAIVDDLMDWRGKSRSRSRSVMDWRGQSRSRSRPPPGHHGANALKSHFIPTLPTHTPSPDTANNTDAGESTPEQPKQHQPSRVKHELTTTIEEDNGPNDFYNFGAASSLPDPQTFLHYAEQHQTNRANDPQQNFYDLLGNNKAFLDITKSKSAQQPAQAPSASLLSKSLSSSYGSQAHDQTHRDAVSEAYTSESVSDSTQIARKRPAEYSPKFATLFNNTGNGQSEPPPFSLTSSYMPYQNEGDNGSGAGAEGSFGPPGIDVNENLVFPDGFPDDGGLSALLSQSAPGGHYAAFPPTIPQSLPTFYEYANGNEEGSQSAQPHQPQSQDLNSFFNMIYGANSAPTTPSFADTINPFAAIVNPGNLQGKNREIKSMRAPSTSHSSSRIASHSPQIPSAHKAKSPVAIQAKPQKRDSGLSSSVPSIPIAAKKTSQPQGRSSYVPLRQAPSKSPSNNLNFVAPQAGINPVQDQGSAVMTCYNCKTTKTPLWRRDPEGNSLCNACGLFLKLHGVVRPLSLKSDVIKKRNRNGPGSNNPKASGKKSSKEAPQSVSQTPSSSGGSHQVNVNPNPNASTSTSQDNYSKSSPALLPFMGLQQPPPPIVNTKKRRTSAVQQQQLQQLQERQIESSIGYLSIDRPQ
ncbi:hypothetical protein E3P99_01856 [Wallemia hederae]|uniref:GATA-type domain-containing protein n=1 Tax=Wallemia hederae TaxID=1540922 RepID=A0A4T0FPS1_9BASI|nr:hypothetical protein E3P99_01856 [Wallemia hederae]